MANATGTTDKSAGGKPSSVIGLEAAVRTAAGKSEARRLRRSGMIPAIAYGKGLPATSISVAPKDILGILKSERGRNNVIKLNVAGGAAKDILVMIRDYSYHPVKRDLEHVDFVEVKLDQEVDVDIPLVFTGKPVGVTEGGIIRQVYRTVPVRALPDRIPLKIEIDITHLALGEAVSTSDLKLDEGVTARLPAEQTLIAIVTPDKDRVAEEEAAAAAVAGVAAATAGAAPAAGATPAKAAEPAKKK
jgi:large subunit ribosomal protein L25